MQQVIQEKDLFRGYEVRNWNFSPRIYKILAASAIINVVAVIVFAQTNLLTTKGCDSPFVNTVCQVLDAVYVGNTLFGTDGDYVVKEYNKTEIGENEEVTFIDVSNVTPPLSYPANYFALANPDQYHLDENGIAVQNNSFENLTPPINQINPVNPTTPNYPSPLINTKPNLPAPNKPTTGDIYGSPWEVVNNPTLSNKGKKPRKSGKNPTIQDDLPKPDGDETADKDKQPKVDERTSTNSDPVTAIEKNKKPFQKLGEFVATKWSINPDKTDNKIDLKPFKVALNAKLTKKIVKDENGVEKEVIGLDGKKSKWIDLPKEEIGDAEMVEIAREAIEAVGDSGYLGYLYNLGMKDLKITLTQKDNKIFATIESEQPTPERANSLASGLNGLIAGAKLIVKGEDEKFLLESAIKNPPTNKGKMFILNVELSKDAVQQMIVRKIADEAKNKAEEEKKNNPAKSTAQTNVKTGK